MKHYDFIIAGAGSSGRTAAETLAAESGGRSILLIDTENVLPYKRTKVSKSIYTGYEPEDFAVLEISWYPDNGVELIKGQTATTIDPENHTILLESETFSYSSLLLATGAKPRTPFEHLPPGRWSSLWTVQDGLKLNERLAGLKRVAVVGVGVLGVEASWQTSLMGLETILVGRSCRPMSKYLDSVSAESLEIAIRNSGVTLMLEHGVLDVGPDSDGSGVLIETDKGSLNADFAIIAAGAAPNTSLADSGGLQVKKGIVVDSGLKTSAEDIWAAGDCAEHPGAVITGLWHSAEHQGQIAARGMLGRPSVNDNPSFRLKCEVFGGFWFSAGPINEPVTDSGLGPAETWESNDVLWRPRFKKGKLAALAGAAPSGMEKSVAKTAQSLVLRGADRIESMTALGGS